LARFYFHLRDGEEVLLDPEGRELADAGAIAEAALREARAMVSDEALTGRIRLDQQIEVHDAEGRIVHRLGFADAVEIVPSRPEGSQEPLVVLPIPPRPPGGL
jgi:hypothetical protein